MAAEDDITNRAREYASAQIVVGTVGWADREAHFDRGDPDADPGERHTLVNVTLYAGKDPNVRPQLGVASGRKIQCCMSAIAGLRVPTKGTRVYVALPFGMEESPGAGCIFATVENEQRNNLSRGEVVIPGAEGEAKAVIRNDGTFGAMTTTTNTPDGKVVAFLMSPTALKFTAPWGSFTFDASGFHLRTKAGPRIDMGGVSIPGLPDALTGALSGYFTVTSPTVKLAGGSVFLGAGKIFNPAVWSAVNPTFPPPIPLLPGVSIQSQTVWVVP